MQTQATWGGAAGRWAGAPVAFFRHRILGKIVIPYLILVVLIAAFFLSLTINLVATSLEFRDELADAGRAANEAMVKVEERHLSVLRSMVFTNGVDSAVAARDGQTLAALLSPIMVSQRVAYVDVFAPDGTALLALRAPELGPDAAARIDPRAAAWPPVRDSLARRVDDLGEKFAAVVDTPWGPLFVVTAPVQRGSELLGVMSVATPLSEINSTLSTEAGSKPLTLYATDGRVLTSTVRAAPERLAAYLGLPPEVLAAFERGDHIVTRRTAIDSRPFVEAVGTLAIRRQPALLMGVGNVISIIDERVTQAGRIIVPAALVFGVLVMGIGLLLANRIARPVRTLVDATRRVRRNELDFTVPIETADEVGMLSEAFNETIVGLQERARAQRAIERYISPRVYRLVQEDRLQLGGVAREITVFKTDIRDFTALSGTMSATALVDFLNRYFERMVACVATYGGEVDKYMGDSVLAKFGATEPDPAHAEHAVLAMVEMIEQCELLNAELVQEGLPCIRMGIGANTGEAVVGNIGSEQRMEYTIISEAVNVAQRIEELCKPLGWDLVISEHTLERAGGVVEVGSPWEADLRGVSRRVLVYPVLGRRGAVPRARRRAYYELLAQRGASAAPGVALAQAQPLVVKPMRATQGAAAC